MSRQFPRTPHTLVEGRCHPLVVVQQSNRAATPRLLHGSGKTGLGRGLTLQSRMQARETCLWLVECWIPIARQRN